MALGRKNSKKQSPRVQKPDALGTIVLSSRVRLARNVAGRRFPDWASPEELEQVAKELTTGCLLASEETKQSIEAVDVREGLDTGFSYFLCEDGFISNVLMDRAAAKKPTWAVVPNDYFPEKFIEENCSKFSVMINEEDHLRIQSIHRGYELETAWQEVDRFDTLLNQHVKYAFSAKEGYLTACPSNVGTGMRASVEVVLPGIMLLDEFEEVQRAVTRLGFNFRGMSGEGSALTSGIVQISTGGTLGRTEQQAIASLKHLVDEVIKQEKLARTFICKKKPKYLLDYLGRALGILKGARMLETDEALACLSALRLGVELGMLKGRKVNDIEGASAYVGRHRMHEYLRTYFGHEFDLDAPMVDQGGEIDPEDLVEEERERDAVLRAGLFRVFSDKIAFAKGCE